MRRVTRQVAVGAIETIMPAGRPKAQYSQALRVLGIYEMLQHRGSITIPQIMEEYGVDRRTVQRDLGVLAEQYAIEEGERTAENLKTFQLRPGARTGVLTLTVAEMLSLYLGRDLFSFLEGTQLKDAMDKLYGKLEARLSGRNAALRETLPKKLYCTVGFPKSYGGSEDVLNDVLTALLKERKLELTYRRPGKKPYKDVVHPYTLVAHNHALYVICHSERAGERRMLALERILEAAWIRDAPFEYPSDHDPAEALGSAFGITAGQSPVKVRLLFSEKVAPYVVARMWHPSMQCRERSDGRVEMTMEVSVGVELVQWITGYGGDVEVLAPTTLAEEVKERHRAAIWGAA